MHVSTSAGQGDEERGGRGGGVAVATCKANVPGSVLIALDKKLNKMNALIARAGKTRGGEREREDEERER